MERFRTDHALDSAGKPDRTTRVTEPAADVPRTTSAGGGIIMHIALQGCLKSGDIPYGLTSDTGGHIRYLLELVDSLAQRPEVSRQIVVTRAFDDPGLGQAYSQPEEALCPGATLWRCRGDSTAYLPKEALWQEVPALVASLLQRMRQEQIFPDVIHAHYADAGVVAMQVRKALGIPYVFTAHSLGATKALHLPASAADRALKRRVRLEELVVKNANRLIASSEHEARAQYGLYRHHNPAKTLVNPPGCNLESFRSPASPEVAQQVDLELRRFLRRPDRPCLLAIARPVEKKNLCALVKAYGESPLLRQQANLVIYAGTRSDIDSGEPEARRVWAQLLQLIDRYDLYGDVAYPKYHELRHVPAIYQWAAKRRGVFVNPALNEPFGLTLLEAAAAGLPVVATREGGPVDIVARCQNGLLVPPTDTVAIASACHHLLDDELTWRRCSSRGRRNVDYYSWHRHADQYLGDTAFCRPATAFPSTRERQVTSMLVTDMDGTLLGHKQGLKELERWLGENPQCLFVVATGRAAEQALAHLEAWGAPRPDFLIADVGSSIYRFDKRGDLEEIRDWQDELNEGWQRELCQKVLDAHPELTLQPEHNQSPYKLSYFIQGSRPVRLSVERMLVAAGLDARVVCSHGNLLDVLPSNGGKSGAVAFIRRYFNMDRQQVVAAGDAGNDLDLLQEAGFGIVVANHTPELATLAGYEHIYWARSDCAAGVLEGLVHRSGMLLQEPSVADRPNQPTPPTDHYSTRPSGAAELEAGA